MTSSAQRPAWVVPTLLVALFTVVYLSVRVAGQEGDQPAFPTQRVPAPSASPTSNTPSQPDYGLALTATGLGSHHFGEPESTVVEALTALLGVPTEDAPEECISGRRARWVRWADLSIRLDAGSFAGYVEGTHYPPGPPPFAIATADGLAPGDQAARLFELYDRATISEVPAPTPSRRDAIQFEITDGGSLPLVVIVEGSRETGQVVAISAGDFCPSPERVQ